MVAQGKLGPTACSVPSRCWRSTTRTTCRPKPRTPSNRPRRRARRCSNERRSACTPVRLHRLARRHDDDPRTRPLRTDPRAARWRWCSARCRWSAPAGDRAPSWMRAGAPGGAGPVPVRRHRLRSASCCVRRQRLLGRQRRHPTPTRSCRWPTGSPPPGARTKVRCCCGSLMLARAGRSRSASSAATCRAEMVARMLGVMGLVSVGFLLFMLLTSQPVRAPAARGAGRPRPEPAAAGPGHGDPPADALHGLRRLLGRLCLRDRRAARRPARRRLGALVAPLDHGRLGVPDDRHRARQLVGLLRTRLGRLVVLGSGRERLLHALAGRHRADPLAGRHREARRASRAGPCCWRSSRSR